MPEVYAESIIDVRLGTQMVGGLMVGTDEIYVRLERHIYDKPGNFSLTLPDWASSYGVLISGGGGGGRAGNGGNNAIGLGGKGGAIKGISGRLTTSSDRVLTGFIGAGGAGGASSKADGQKGGNTSLTAHDSTIYIAEGGTAYPNSGKQNGGISSITFSNTYHKYFNLPPDTPYKNGPAGTGNGGAGKFGGGGAGGNGGVFNNYTRGGRGGDGYVEVYVWGLPRHSTSPTPPTPDTVQITLGTDLEARDQLRAALSDRGLHHTTVTEIPFDIALFGEGSARDMFRACSALTSVPDMDTTGVTSMRSMFNGCSALTSVSDMDTSQVTDMQYMFQDCASLTYVPDLDTNKVTNMNSMFRACSALTDGNVLLIGRHPNVTTTDMITDSGLTKEPFYDDDPTIETVQITLDNEGLSQWQFRDALSTRGLNHTTVEEIPFDIELVGTGSTQYMFQDCSSLTSAPAIDTSQVTKMEGMFNGCSSLTSVTNMDTSQVTNMASMFDGCSSLTSVTDMDTSQVTNMSYMFLGCSSLTSVSDMDTSQVTNMTSMFQNCSALTNGNVRLIGRHPNVDTTYMITDSGLTREPFYEGKEVVKITGRTTTDSRDQLRAAIAERGLDYQTVTELPFDLDTSQAASFQEMFRDMAALTTVPPMDTRQAFSTYQMFRGCKSLTYVGDLRTTNVIAAGGMFFECEALMDGAVRLIGKNPNVTTLNMLTSSGLTREPFDITTEVVVINLGSGFAARDQFRAALTDRDLDYATITEIPFDISLAGSGEAIHLFYGCNALTSVPPLNTGNVTNMNGMFQVCSSLVTVPPLDTRNVVRAPSMFAYCASLTSVPTMDAAKMVDVSNMFIGCSSLTTVPPMDTSQAKDMSAMFRSCTMLTHVPDLDASSATSVNYMFYNCSALTDGNVRLIGKNPAVTTENMITGSGLTREPWGT